MRMLEEVDFYTVFFHDRLNSNTKGAMMGVKFKGTMLNPVEVQVEHESGNRIATMAPKDNGGDGSRFSPTDLCTASLGVCMTTIMGMVARDHKIPLDGITFELEKIMSAAPRRIAAIRGTVWIRSSCREAEWTQLVDAGRHCPVALSLHPDLKQEISFVRQH